MTNHNQDWKPLYFHTQDTALALALAVVGQTLVCIWNDYGQAQLEKLKCTAREAWARGVPGTVRYYFEPTDEIEALKAAFYDERSRLQNGNGSTIDIEPEPAVRLLAACLTQRARWSELWKSVTPTVTTRQPGEVTRVPDEDGTGFRINIPGLKTVSINASREVKEKLEKL